MLIDFNGLEKLIPVGGSLTLTVKKGEGDKLDVLFQAKHDLPAFKNHSARTTDEGKKIEEASKLAGKPYAFSATAQELTASFEECIKQPIEVTKSLVDVITDRTKALEEAAKSIKTAATKTKATEKGKTADPAADKTAKALDQKEKDALPLTGNLFGSVGSDTVKTEASSDSDKPASVQEAA